ncbi:unnamed protein product [Leptidea sinapis]|uniref:Ras-GEF domain-containing protein n=1 Tax=Leptidea sinapis TaxID=189913 RepID=A0A5E4QIW0_9NEOP|nr:unnamed protein product [Leptidea sinapis]
MDEQVSPPAADAECPSPEPVSLSDSALIGTGLTFYGVSIHNDDYYSMVRGSTFLAESGVTHLMMNGGLNLVAAQKIDPTQLPTVLQGKSITLPFMGSDKPEVEYKDGQIVSATIDGLVDLLRPEKEVADMVALVRVLDQWTTMFPYDFRDDRVMAIVKNITQRCSAEHMASVRAEVSAILERLLDKLTALERYEETLVHVPQHASVDALPQGDILTLGLTPVELANQLTIVELHRLSFVGPEELVQTFAPNQPCSSTKGLNLHHLDVKCTKNLEAYADWFNRLSYLVATDILKWGRTSPVCGQQLKQLELCVEPSGNHARVRVDIVRARTPGRSVGEGSSEAVARRLVRLPDILRFGQIPPACVQAETSVIHSHIHLNTQYQCRVIFVFN